MNTPEELKAIDSLIGKRIRLRRLELGWSQEKLAAMLGITFQQVQKYEKGTNRVSGSRMTQLSGALKVPEGYFFGTNRPSTDDAEADADALGLLTIPGALHLVQNYAKMTRGQRSALSQLSASIVGAPQPSEL